MQPGWQQVSCHLYGGTLSYNGSGTGHGEEIYYNASFETLDQLREWAETEEQALEAYRPDSLTVSGGRIEGAESMIAIDAHSGQNFVLSGKTEVRGAILTATDKSIIITDEVSGPYRIALTQPDSDELTFTAGVFTNGLDGKGAAGSFIGFADSEGALHELRLF